MASCAEDVTDHHHVDDFKKCILDKYGSVDTLQTMAKCDHDYKAQFDLATVYEIGIPELNIKEDFKKAFQWYKRAAEDDHSYSFRGTSERRRYLDLKFKALKKLHDFYLCGKCPEGEAQPIKALYHLQKAAELGDPEAQKDLGLSYLTGESGKPKDIDKAKKWLHKAAKNGNSQAHETLKKFDEKNAAVPIEDPDDEQIAESTWLQYLQTDLERQMKEAQFHPFAIQNPQMFNENTFRQHPDSPTAQRYLKAKLLVSEGIKKLQRSNFTDPDGITLLARGLLYENTITRPYDPIILLYRNSLEKLILIEQSKNPHFFEGSVFLIFKIMPVHNKLSMESSKLDFRKVMALNNLIDLIKEAEPGKPPKEDPYNYEEDYSSWLHVLYFYLGSYYTISHCLRDGAVAFEKALQCCPNYCEAKFGLANCLMNMPSGQNLSPDEELLNSFELPDNQRIPKGDFLTWTRQEQLEKGKELYMEYLEKAPVCDKKYPNCHYHLAYFYMNQGDLEECLKWKEKAEEAEEKRLPFLEPVDTDSKTRLAIFDQLPVAKVLRKNMSKSKKMLENKKKCSNKKCKKSGECVGSRCPSLS